MKLIKYPRTPKKYWKQIKFTDKDRAFIRNLSKKEKSATAITKIANDCGIDISRSGVRLIIDPRFKQVKDQWRRENPEAFKSSRETLRNVRLNKIQYCGKRYRLYQLQAMHKYRKNLKKNNL